MILNKSFIIRDRQQAANVLAEKLMHSVSENAIVVGVPYGGAVIGYHLSKRLNLPFNVVACKSLVHPGDQRKTIGSVSATHVVVHDEAHDIPRDYIYHQIVSNQNDLRIRQDYYNASQPDELLFRDAEVIVVGDIVKSADALIACVKTIRSQRPGKIVVAAPVLTPDAVAQLGCEVDEIISLSIEQDIPASFYEFNEIVRDEDIRDFVFLSRGNQN